MGEEVDVFKTRPIKDITAVEQPAVYLSIPTTLISSMMQIYHPHHGWLAFLFPPDMARKIGATFLEHAGICEHHLKITPPSTPRVQ
jgi:hypothetical protein